MIWIYLNNLSWQELIQLFYLNFVCKLILMQTRINQVFHIFTTQILNAAFRVKLSHWQWPSDDQCNEMCFQFAWRLIQIHKSGKSIWINEMWMNNADNRTVRLLQTSCCWHRQWNVIYCECHQSANEHQSTHNWVSVTCVIA